MFLVIYNSIVSSAFVSPIGMVFYSYSVQWIKTYRSFDSTENIVAAAIDSGRTSPKILLASTDKNFKR